MKEQKLFINDFYIYHFKKIKETGFECGSINIFTGANNSGKSSVLTAIHFFYSIWQATITKNNKNKFIIDASGNAKSAEYFKYGASSTENDFLFLPTVNLEDIAYSDLKHTSQSKTDVIIFKANNKSIGLRISHNTNRKSFSLNLTHKNFFKIDEKIQPSTVLSFYSPGLSGISDREIHYGDQYVRNRAGYSGTAGNILRNILWRIWQDNQKREGFLEDIYAIYKHERDKTILKIIAPSEDIAALKDDGKDNEFLEFKVEIPYVNDDGETNSKQIPLNQMGSGFLQVMQILAYKNLYQPKVMLLDEPEIHLHGTLIKKLFQVLEGWGKDETNPTQIFISTHSQTVLSYLLKDNTPKELYRLFNVQNGNVISKDIDEENIEAILTKDLGENFLSPAEIERLKEGDFKLLLLSEDADPQIHRLISEDLKKKVRVISGSGADSSSITNRVKSLRENFPNKQILVHVDKDKEQNYKDNKDIDFWFTEYATIEGYFLKYLEDSPCDAGKLQRIKEDIKNNSKDAIKRIWKQEKFEKISALNTLIEHTLLSTLKECEYSKSGSGDAVKKIYGIVKDKLAIQKVPDYINCPSLTKKIKELLGK